MDLVRSLRTVRERKGLVFLATLLAVIALVFAPIRKSLEAKQYQSSAKFLVTPSSAMSLVSSSLSGSTITAPSSLQAWFSDENTLRDLVTSEELLNRVIAKLKSTQTWMQMRQQIALSSVQGQSGRTSSNMYIMAVTAEDPDTSRKLTAALAEELTLFVQDLSAREYSNYRRFIEELASEAEGKVKKAEALVVRLRKGDLQGDNPLSPYNVQVQALTTQRSQLAVEQSKLRAEVEALQSNSGTSTPWTIVEQKNPNLTGLETELAKEKLQLRELNSVFKPGDEMVVAQEEKVAKIQEAYNREVKSYVVSLRNEKAAALDQVQRSFQVVSSQLDTLISKQLTVSEKLDRAKAERQLTMWQENYLTLTRQLYQARVLEQASRRQGAITVLERPQPGIEVVPIGSKKAVSPTVRVLMGLPFCLLFGIGVALAVDYLFASMRIQPRVEETLGLPVIALIPQVSRGQAERWERMKRTGVKPQSPTSV